MFMEKEAAIAELQQKLANAEKEEVRRAKEHEKKVQVQRAVAAKSYAERLRLKAEQDKQELVKRKVPQQTTNIKQQELLSSHNMGLSHCIGISQELARTEAQLTAKLDAEEAARAKERAEQVALREQERDAKIAQLEKRSEEMIQLQFTKAEISRKKLEEREARVQAQLQVKQQQKAEEVRQIRDAAAIRIQAALERNVQIQREKKLKFDQKQAAAAIRGEEKHGELLVTVKKQADARYKKEDMRERRIEDAYRIRAERREGIIRDRNRRDGQYNKIHEARAKDLEARKLMSQLKKEDALDNVKRIQRQEEFNRLQLMRQLESQDERCENIKLERAILLEKVRQLLLLSFSTNVESHRAQRFTRDVMWLEQRREAMKAALLRKHTLQETMEQMRITNDFTLIDNLFT